MKHNFFVSGLLCAGMLGFSVTSDASSCSCAGRCATGSTCNCSTGACSIPVQQAPVMVVPVQQQPMQSPYAYGYVDTRAPMPVYQQQPAYQNYRMAAPYRTEAPSRKYNTHRAAPYLAVRAGFHNIAGDLKYHSSFDGDWKKDFDDDVFALSLAFGTKFSNSFRAELEGSLFTSAESKLDFNSGYGYDFNTLTTEVSAKTLMLNVFYDIPTGTRLTPFIGGGIGVAHLTGKLKGVDDSCSECGPMPISEKHSKLNFAWQLGAGLSYAISEAVNFDFAYRYTYFGDAKIQSYDGYDDDVHTFVKDNTDAIDLSSHSLSAGLRFNF